MSALRVAAIMCVRDGERYLTAAIESLLDQTRPPDEIVVVDDGSTDETPAILRSFGDRLVVLTQPPTGIFAAMNRGVERSTGDVLGFLDADDLAPRSAYEARLSVLAADDDCDGVVGRVEQFASPDVAADVMARFVVDTTPVLAPSFPATLFRRSLWNRVGPLDEARRTGSTIDWLSRARTLGVTLREIDDIVVRRRVHGDNIGAREPEATRQNLLDVVRAHHRRTRGER